MHVSIQLWNIFRGGKHRYGSLTKHLVKGERNSKGCKTLNDQHITLTKTQAKTIVENMKAELNILVGPVKNLIIPPPPDPNVPALVSGVPLQPVDEKLKMCPHQSPILTMPRIY